MIPSKTGLFLQFNIPQSGREYDRSVWGYDLSYSPVNARNQAATTRYHFVTVTDPCRDKERKKIRDIQFEWGLLVFFLLLSESADHMTQAKTLQ